MQFFLNGAEATLSDLLADDLPRAVVNSLFSWRRAEPDDKLVGRTKFGWWADTFLDSYLESQDRFGSRLWLLIGGKLTEETIAQAEEYAREALNWLIEDGVASSVKAYAERNSNDRLDLQIDIVRPDGQNLSARFEDVWEGLK